MRLGIDLALPGLYLGYDARQRHKIHRATHGRSGYRLQPDGATCQRTWGHGSGKGRRGQPADHLTTTAVVDKIHPTTSADRIADHRAPTGASCVPVVTCRCLAHQWQCSSNPYGMAPADVLQPASPVSWGNGCERRQQPVGSSTGGRQQGCSGNAVLGDNGQRASKATSGRPFGANRFGRMPLRGSAIHVCV